MDLKGIPPVIMNHVLKRHPLALRCIRRQLEEVPREATPNSNDDDDDFLENSIADSSLADSGGRLQESGQFEETMPTGDFM